MKKKIVSCLMICIVIVLSYFYAHIDKNTYLYNRNTETGMFYGTGLLQEGEMLTQTFVAKEDVLNGINIKLTTVGNMEEIVLNYSLFDEMSKEVVKQCISGMQIENNKFNQLKFPTIKETADAQYMLVLSVENTDEQNGISFYIEPGTQDEQKLVVREHATDGTLVVRTISHRFDVETFVVLLGLIVFIILFMKILYKFFK